MEILNNLWLAVSTPNEELMNLITIPLFFVEVFIIMQLFIYIADIKASTYQKIIYIISASCSSIITNFFIPNPFNIFLNYFVIIILIYTIFKSSFLKTISSFVFSLIVFNLIQILTLNPYITLLNISAEQLNVIPFYKLLYLFIMYLFTLIIISFLKNKKYRLNILDDIDKKNKIIIISNLFFGILAIFVQSITLFYYVDKLPIIITFLSFISLLAYFIISIYSLTKVFKLILTTQKLESAEEYNKTLHILHDSVRGFKHDFDNIVTTIGGYIKTNDMEGLEKYYSQLQEDCSKVNNLYILNPDIINNPGIYNLLTTKYSDAEEKGIKVNLTFLLDLNELHMKIYEFARILGILLDNAIDAASECDEKILNIVFRNETKNNRNIILVENTYKDKNVDLNEIFNKGVTGKDNHTGLGLWEVRQIPNKNNNINLHTNKNEKYFTQQLEIYY